MMREVMLAPPGDKSISHRALLLAALARGTSAITNLLPAEDVRSTARVLRQLGVRVTPIRAGRVVEVQGRGRRLRRPGSTLHCGNSGTTARLLLGVLAAQPFAARLSGDRSLRGRPMRRVTTPLAQMGARFPRGDEQLPLVVRGGPLVPLDYVSTIASGQVKSAIILAGLAGQVPVRLSEPFRSRDHTERLLGALGLDVSRENGGTLVVVPDDLPPFDLAVPGDASSAAFLVAAAVLSKDTRLELRNVGVNATRAGFLRVLKRMGACVGTKRRRLVQGEPVADLVTEPGVLRGTVVRASEIPSLVDEVPVLAILASRAEGTTVFQRVGELRVKESDRLGLLAANLAGLGSTARVRGDALIVEGSRVAPTGRVDTAADHRLAMAFAVLGTLPGARIRLSERASVATSYPDFFHDLARVVGRARHRD